MVISRRLEDWLRTNYVEDDRIARTTIFEVKPDGAYNIISDDYVIIIYNNLIMDLAVSLTITDDRCFVGRVENKENEEVYNCNSVEEGIKLFNKLADQNLPIN